LKEVSLIDIKEDMRWLMACIVLGNVVWWCVMQRVFGGVMGMDGRVLGGEEGVEGKWSLTVFDKKAGEHG
jgi:hypothetical protein